MACSADNWGGMSDAMTVVFRAVSTSPVARVPRMITRRATVQRTADPAGRAQRRGGAAHLDCQHRWVRRDFYTTPQVTTAQSLGASGLTRPQHEPLHTPRPVSE